MLIFGRERVDLICRRLLCSTVAQFGHDRSAKDEVVHEMGAPRISTFIHLGTRTDRNQTMDEKIKSVEAKLSGCGWQKPRQERKSLILLGLSPS